MGACGSKGDVVANMKATAVAAVNEHPAVQEQVAATNEVVEQAQDVAEAAANVTGLIGDMYESAD